jgi:hypothetical protein
MKVEIVKYRYEDVGDYLIYEVDLGISVSSMLDVELESAKELLVDYEYDDEDGNELDTPTTIPIEIPKHIQEWLKEPRQYKTYIDYPLKVVAEVEFPKLSTIEEMLWHTAQAYKRIYNQERWTSEIKEDEISGTYNRNKTDGMYGIWGHALEDLSFGSIQLYKNGVVVIQYDS